MWTIEDSDRLDRQIIMGRIPHLARRYVDLTADAVIAWETGGESLGDVAARHSTSRAAAYERLRDYYDRRDKQITGLSRRRRATKKCGQCGQEFPADYPLKKMCSTKCELARRAKQNRGYRGTRRKGARCTGRTAS